MKRLWIFLVVGPLIGFFGAFFDGAGSLLGILYLLLLLVLFYVFGAIPALLACFVDHALADKVGAFKRAAVTSLVGCAVGIVMAACFPEHVGMVAMGIAGAVAGLICSLLSSSVAEASTMPP